MAQRLAPRGSKDRFDERFFTPLWKDSLIHCGDMTAAEKKALFKRNVGLFEFEPHNFCNHTCTFCPNSVFDRKSIRQPMGRDLYLRILRQLHSIEYDRKIRYARYCEPLALDTIYEMVSLAREHLPESTIEMNKNGDYLDGRTLDRLNACGLSVLFVSVYLKEGQPWTANRARQQFEKVADKMGKEFDIVWSSELKLLATVEFSGVSVYLESNNFSESGFDRGGRIENLTDDTFTRITPCFLQASNFTMDYNGTVLPCCNMRGDDPHHRSLIIANMMKEDRTIFDIYASERYTRWRSDMAVFGKKFPCISCKQKDIHPDRRPMLKKRIGRVLEREGIILENDYPMLAEN